MYFGREDLIEIPLKFRERLKRKLQFLAIAIDGSPFYLTI